MGNLSYYDVIGQFNLKTFYVQTEPRGVTHGCFCTFTITIAGNDSLYHQISDTESRFKIGANVLRNRLNKQTNNFF